MLLGVLFSCLSGITSPLMNGVAKLLGESYSSLQISWARAFGHILFMLAVFVPRFGRRMPKSYRPSPSPRAARNSAAFLSATGCHTLAHIAGQCWYD